MLTAVFLPAPVPAEELDVPSRSCFACGRSSLDVYWGDNGYYCEACIEGVIVVMAKEAELYAHAHCKIERDLPRYDPRFEFRCTREEYECGARESYTRNSHAAHYRHNCTNYDRLLVLLGVDRDTFSLRGKVYYTAIRARIDELLEKQVFEDEKQPLDEEEHEDEGEDEEQIVEGEFLSDLGGRLFALG